MFAQTYVGGRHEGVQAFMVRIRDADLKPMKGVTIEDMGKKLGQNGVDNAVRFAPRPRRARLTPARRSAARRKSPSAACACRGRCS